MSAQIAGIQAPAPRTFLSHADCLQTNTQETCQLKTDHCKTFGLKFAHCLCKAWAQQVESLLSIAFSTL